MPRTILVGDVHGCSQELRDLLRWVGFRPGDRLVMVGDLVVRGPDPHGVVALCRKLGARCVRGNHEDRLLRWRASLSTAQPLPIGSLTRRTAEQLKASDWDYLDALPLRIFLEEHDLWVVHAGIDPRRSLLEQEPRTLMYVRSIDALGEPRETRAERSWAQHYHGKKHIVFGHNAQDEPELAPRATGLDTSCVYGGRLTAMVLRAGERVPDDPAERLATLVSVPAHRAYVARRAKPLEAGP